MIFDRAGNAYGVTSTGGSNGCFLNRGCGTVYELSPASGGWVETTLYVFQGGVDGERPVGVTLDANGDLVGVTSNGGSNDLGTIFQLTPSGGGWTKSVIYNFESAGPVGSVPQAGFISDAAGNLYGSTTLHFLGHSGYIYELSPAGGGWTITALAAIPDQYRVGPSAPLTLDAAGNLYGTLGDYSGSPLGAVFKLTHGSDGWNFTSLHDFTGGSDGGQPQSTVAIGSNGKLYGTASRGGTCGGTGCGVVWEIAP